MDAASRDPRAVALDLLAQASFLTLATADASGVPWASPVWFAARDLSEFVWASKPGARHSLNIAERSRISLVIFDSSGEPGEGSGLYIVAEAALVDGDRFDEALALYNERSTAAGLHEWLPEKLREPARHRLYGARALEVFVLDDHDERVRVD